jgi:2-iminobutanoate/2-iminopropanoate deaminase
MATETKSVVRTESAPAPFQGAPYSQAIRTGGFVFVSGQLGLNAILQAAGTGLERLVKTTVFLADLGDFGSMNEVYARYVGASPPARSTVEVAALPSGAKVEIEAIAEL